MTVRVKQVIEPSDTSQVIKVYAHGYAHEWTREDPHGTLTSSSVGQTIVNETDIEIPASGSVTVHDPAISWEQTCGGGATHTIYIPVPEVDPSTRPSGGPGGGSGPGHSPKPVYPTIVRGPFPPAKVALVLMLDALNHFLEEQTLPPATLTAFQVQVIDPLLNAMGGLPYDEGHPVRERLAAPDGLVTRFGTPEQQRYLREVLHPGD